MEGEQQPRSVEHFVLTVLTLVNTLQGQPVLFRKNKLGINDEERVLPLDDRHMAKLIERVFAEPPKGLATSVAFRRGDFAEAQDGPVLRDCLVQWVFNDTEHVSNEQLRKIIDERLRAAQSGWRLKTTGIDKLMRYKREVHTPASNWMVVERPGIRDELFYRLFAAWVLRVDLHKMRSEFWNAYRGDGGLFGDVYLFLHRDDYAIYTQVLGLQLPPFQPFEEPPLPPPKPPSPPPVLGCARKVDHVQAAFLLRNFTSKSQRREKMSRMYRSDAFYMVGELKQDNDCLYYRTDLHEDFEWNELIELLRERGALEREPHPADFVPESCFAELARREPVVYFGVIDMSLQTAKRQKQ